MREVKRQFLEGIGGIAEFGPGDQSDALKRFRTDPLQRVRLIAYSRLPCPLAIFNADNLL